MRFESRFAMMPSMKKKIGLSLILGLFFSHCASSWQAEIRKSVNLPNNDYQFINPPIGKNFLGSVLYLESLKGEKKFYSENFSPCFAPKGDKKMIPLNTIDTPHLKIIGAHIEVIELGDVLPSCPLQDGKVHRVVTEQLVIDHFSHVQASSSKTESGENLTYALRLTEITIPQK